MLTTSRLFLSGEKMSQLAINLKPRPHTPMYRRVPDNLSSFRQVANFVYLSRHCISIKIRKEKWER